MNLKFLYPLIGLTLGIFLTVDFFQSIWFGIICIGLSLIIWLFFHILSSDPIQSLKISQYHFIWISLLFTGIGNLEGYYLGLPYLDNEIDNRKVRIIAEIKKVNCLTSGDRFHLEIKNLYDSLGNEITSRNLNFLLNTNGFVGNPGDIISFTSRPQKLFGTHYAEIMRHQGVLYTDNRKADNIKKIDEAKSLSKYFYDIKEHFIILLEKSSLNKETRSFLISILLGDRSFLSEETRHFLNSAGLAHVLALSGMHVAIILSVFLFLLFPLSLMGYHKTRYIIAIILVWLFVFITGASPSTVRAGIMATFVMGAYLLERKNSALNSLLAAMFIILLFSPLDLWNVGLQLSFICIASIIIFANSLNPIEHHIHPKTYKVINASLVAIITSVATWVLVAYYFKSVPILFLPANLIILPVLPFFLSIGLFYLVLLSFDIDWNILSELLNYVYNWIIKIVDFVSLSGSSILNLEIPFSTVILWLLGIIFVALAIHHKSRKLVKFFSIGACVCLIGSIGLTLTYHKNETLSLRFVHSFAKLETQLISNESTSRFEFPRGKVASLKLKDFHIISIDNSIHQDSIYKFIEEDKNKDKFLMVGPGANINQIAQLTKVITIKKIILHPQIGKNKKEELIDLLESPFEELVYSLRENGSIKFEL